MIKVGIVGTNTSHAGVFADILNRGAAGDARADAVWSSGREGLSGFHDDAPTLAAKYGIAQVCGSADELIGAVDAVLILDDYAGGELHGELAEPFLRAGVATFVDKPMALDLASATALFDLAEENGALVMSASALRFSPELAAVGSSVVGALSSVTCVGPGDWYNYGVHAVEMACTIAPGPYEWVQGFAEPNRDTVVVGGTAAPTLVVQTLRDAAAPFHASSYGSTGAAHTDVSDAAAFYTATMTAFIASVSSGTPAVSRADTLQVLDILGAAQRSAASGARVAINIAAQEA